MVLERMSLSNAALETRCCVLHVCERWNYLVSNPCINTSYVGIETRPFFFTYMENATPWFQDCIRKNRLSRRNGSPTLSARVKNDAHSIWSKNNRRSVANRHRNKLMYERKHKRLGTWLLRPWHGNETGQLLVRAKKYHMGGQEAVGAERSSVVKLWSFLFGCFSHEYFTVTCVWGCVCDTPFVCLALTQC